MAARNNSINNYKFKASKEEKLVRKLADSRVRVETKKWSGSYFEWISFSPKKRPARGLNTIHHLSLPHFQNFFFCQSLSASPFPISFLTKLFFAPHIHRSLKKRINSHINSSLKNRNNSKQGDGLIE